jgi:hypothetical protein
MKCVVMGTDFCGGEFCLATKRNAWESRETEKVVEERPPRVEVAAACP